MNRIRRKFARWLLRLAFKIAPEGSFGISTQIGSIHGIPVKIDPSLKGDEWHLGKTPLTQACYRWGFDLSSPGFTSGWFCAGCPENVNSCEPLRRKRETKNDEQLP